MAARKTNDPPPETGPVEELIARFQVETDRRMAAFEQECLRRMGAAEHKAAVLTDEVNALRDEVAGLRKRFEGTEHELRAATNECNTALRRAVECAEQAKDSAAVYERLRDAQPDFRDEVLALRKEVAKVSDRQTLIEGQHASLVGATERLGSKLDGVATDAQATARAVNKGHFAAVQVEGGSL